MTISPNAAQVRHIVQNSFSNLGFRNDELAELDETLLVQDGRVYARSYRLQEHLAMWLIASGIIQFYDEEGRMISTKNLLLEVTPQRGRMTA